MLDLSVAYKKYKFIGSEFLTWLFYVAENEAFRISEDLEIGISTHIVNISFENEMPKETLSIKGDDSVDRDECTSALRRGALVSKIRLAFEIRENIYHFTIHADWLSFSSLNLPQTESIAEDSDGATLERIYLYNQAVEAMDKLFERFIRIRLSNDWNAAVSNIRKWITRD
ncbi:hypothetical protein [Desulforegula conservatrix]|uniref:hypothetical protein n=1 Tax=Desulforegula conservatrix TaxID=153026 RepID=UPI000421B1CA|nr:hypothetical protein [Desulforegula conservatrix]